MSLRLAADAPVAVRIGPNAITQVAAALNSQSGGLRTRQVFRQAGLLRRLETPPTQMVDEWEVIDLYRALDTVLGPQEARSIADEAGRATARYLLRKRIPRLAQWLLRALPAAWAAHLLARAIRRHAWTFAGSGTFEDQPGPPLRLLLHDNPMCRGRSADRPACAFHAAVFERLFRVLVHPTARVTEIECEAAGGRVCCFEVRWRTHHIRSSGTL